MFQLFHNLQQQYCDEETRESVIREYKSNVIINSKWIVVEVERRRSKLIYFKMTIYSLYIIIYTTVMQLHLNFIIELHVMCTGVIYLHKHVKLHVN